jgi:hypothetical protein
VQIGSADRFEELVEINIRSVSYRGISDTKGLQFTIVSWRGYPAASADQISAMRLDIADTSTVYRLCLTRGKRCARMCAILSIDVNRSMNISKRTSVSELETRRCSLRLFIPAARIVWDTRASYRGFRITILRVSDALRSRLHNPRRKSRYAPSASPRRVRLED